MVESLFTIVFAPSCPYIIDPTGEIQRFLKDILLKE
jgi:hypothetical protein